MSWLVSSQRVSSRDVSLSPDLSAVLRVFALVRLWRFPYRLTMKTTLTPGTKQTTITTRTKKTRTRGKKKHWKKRNRRDGNICLPIGKKKLETHVRNWRIGLIYWCSFSLQLPRFLHFSSRHMFMLVIWTFFQGFSFQWQKIWTSVHSSLLLLPSACDGFYQSCVYCNVTSYSL